MKTAKRMIKAQRFFYSFLKGAFGEKKADLLTLSNLWVFSVIKKTSYDELPRPNSKENISNTNWRLISLLNVSYKILPSSIPRKLNLHHRNI